MSHLSDTLATDESKLALVVFSTTVIFTMPYTSSESTFLAALNGLPHTGQRTNLAQALLSAASIVRTDPNSRKAEKLVRKIVFFLTDGAGNEDTHLYDDATSQIKSVIISRE